MISSTSSVQNDAMITTENLPTRVKIIQTLTRFDLVLQIGVGVTAEVTG